MIEFEVRGEFIELNALLKATALVMSGGEAGVLIAEGEVKVNGEVEHRKRRKLRPGDKVEIFDQTILLQ